MFKIKILLSILVFSSFLFGTSIIKNETREIEKKIFSLSKDIYSKEKDLNESQLDFFYLTSPFKIENKVKNLDNENYFPMDYSKIFLSMSDFLNIKNKLAIKSVSNEKKNSKKINILIKINRVFTLKIF